MFLRQNHVTFIFIKTMSHDLLVQVACCRHLHQRVEEHKHSVTEKHFRVEHALTPDNLIKNFKVLKKCRGKLDCLIFEMLLFKNKNTETEYASGFHSRETFYMNIYIYSFLFFFSFFLFSMNVFM